MARYAKREPFVIGGESILLTQGARVLSDILAHQGLFDGFAVSYSLRVRS